MIIYALFIIEAVSYNFLEQFYFFMFIIHIFFENHLKNLFITLMIFYFFISSQVNEDKSYNL